MKVKLNFQNKYCCLFMILSGILSSCIQPQNEKLSDFQVTHFVGSGWTDWHEKLVIHNDGFIQFEKQEPFGGDNFEKSIRLSSEEIAEFKQLIQNANVFDLKDSYHNQDKFVTDLPTHTITFVIKGKEKHIHLFLEEEQPEILNKMIEEIYAIKQKIE
jgi:hypothetical protein